MKDLRKGKQKRLRLLGILAAALFFALLFLPEKASAEIAGDHAFDSLDWKMEFAGDRTGTIQSICATPDYIITIDNAADDDRVNDVVSAYYRNSTDENGNPVKQYSLANRVSNRSWEHGNCMTYNPRTGLVYVALYTNTAGDNAGCVYMMNPKTLDYAGKIQIGDGSYNILGLGYKEETDQYVMQTDAADQYSMKLLDSNFQIIDDFGPINPDPGNNFQGLMVSGDYVINLPLTYGMGIGEWMDVFSLSRRSMIYSGRMTLDLKGAKTSEGEGFCELDDGNFLLAMNLISKDGARMVRFYTARIPQISDALSEDSAVSSPESVPAAEAESYREAAAGGPLGAGTQEDSRTPAGMFDGALETPTAGTLDRPIEAPTIRMLNHFFGGIGNFFTAFVTGNKAAMRRIGTGMGKAWRAAVGKAQNFRLPSWLGWLVLLLILILLGPGMLLYLVYVRRARARSRARTKYLRAQIRRRMEEEEK